MVHFVGAGCGAADSDYGAGGKAPERGGRGDLTPVLW